MMVGMRDSRAWSVEVSFWMSELRRVDVDADVEDEALSFAISAPILESSDWRDASASLIALASFWRRSRSFWGDCRRSFWGDDFPGVVGGRDIDGPRLISVGMLEEREGVLVWPLWESSVQRSLITTTSEVDWMF